MSCQQNAVKLSRAGLKCGLAHLAGQRAYPAGLALFGGGLTGLLVYAKKRSDELTLNNQVMEILACIRTSAQLAYECTLKPDANQPEALAAAQPGLDRALALIRQLPAETHFVDVVRGDLNDMLARVQSGLNLLAQGEVARDGTLKAQLIGRATSSFTAGQTASLGSFLARPSLAGRDATIAGGAAGLGIAGLVWLAQQRQRRRRLYPVRWLPHRPAGLETISASTVDPQRQVRVRYRVVELDEPITSNTVSGELNPAYDQALQPRRRNRAASQLQIERLAAALSSTELLKPAAGWADGPPIVGPDGLVESGNGRLLALRLAARTNPAGYRAYYRQLLEQAGQFGLNRTAIGQLQQPVLVRERLDGAADRVRFVAEANASPAARLSSAEQARADAQLIVPGSLANLQVSDSDRSLTEVLAKQANAPIVHRFLKRLPATEQAALVDRRGRLSVEGLNRLERALFAYAMPDAPGERLVGLVFEKGERIDRVGAGLRQALPKLVQVEDMIRAGQRDPALRLGSDLAISVEKLHDLRRQGLAVPDYLRQLSMFEELTPMQKQLLAQLETRRRSGRAVGEFINAYMAAVVTGAGPPNQTSFGGDRPERETLLRSALKAIGGQWFEIPSPVST